MIWGYNLKSPFVNLWLRPKDFIKLLSSLREYMGYDLKFTTEEGIEYPVGLLKDIKIYFQHYKTEEEAKAKWNERAKRMDHAWPIKVKFLTKNIMMILIM